MAEEAFALSPISARAAQPSEADYDAIREAFMETSRGRWFLGEYAKRNRNTDTLLVLDAVARIEETMAAKKPVRDPLLDEALAALRGALGEAKGTTQAALDDLAFEQNLAPVRKGARVIREIAWRLREIGADGRICDLIDSQVDAIEGAAAKLAPADLTAAIGRAFDLIEERIATFDASDMEMRAPPPAEPATQEALGEAPSPAMEAVAEPAIAAAAPERPSGASGTVGTASVAPEVRAVIDQIMIEDAETAGVGTAEPTDAFTADDEAVLDLIAMEMAAPDTDAAYELPSSEMSAGANAEPHAPPAALSVAEAATAATSVAVEEISFDDIEVTFVTAAKEPPANPAPIVPEPTMARPVQTAAEAKVVAVVASTPSTAAAPDQVKPQPEAAPSLGSSLLANGIVPRPKTSKPDPLAPIRRMTQSEKIAFFS
jgi:hypothetical protein